MTFTALALSTNPVILSKKGSQVCQTWSILGKLMLADPNPLLYMSRNVLHSTVPPGVTVRLNICSSPDHLFYLLWRWVQHLPFSTHWGLTLISRNFKDDRELPCKYISQLLSRQPWITLIWSCGLVWVMLTKLNPVSAMAILFIQAFH